MTDPAKRASITVRPSPRDKAAAMDALKAAGAQWTLEAFISACLRVVARDPETLLALLANDLPNRHEGRPRKDGQPPRRKGADSEAGNTPPVEP